MPIVFERSIIRMGGGSYFITLPIPWIRSLGIRPKDKVEVITNGTDGDLIIRLKERKRLRKKMK